MKTIFVCLCLLIAIASACAPAPAPEPLPPTTMPPTDMSEATEAPVVVETSTEQASNVVADAIATALADEPTAINPTVIAADPTSDPASATLEVEAVVTESVPTVAAEPTSDATAETTAVVAVTQTGADTSAPLRVGVLPVINALPMVVAEAEGFYREEGIAVEIVTFSNARERENAMQAGTIHGETTDIVSVVILNNVGIDMRAVRWDTTATPFFSILVAGESSIQTVADLRNVQVAIAENTVIDFMTRTLLREAGFEESEIRVVNVSSIPRRIEALDRGQVAAATFPEPLTALASAQGARVIVTDAETDVVPTVLAFDTVTLTERPDDVRAFLRAYERAVETINADPAQYRDLLVLSASLPEEVEATYEVPQFRTAGVISEPQFDTVIEWMDSRGMLRQQLEFDAYVDDSFLP